MNFGIANEWIYIFYSALIKMNTMNKMNKSKKRDINPSAGFMSKLINDIFE